MVMNTSPITSYMEADHRRLDALLDDAAQNPNAIDMNAYNEFRRGLLKHIGIEEKVMLPLAAKLHDEDLMVRAAKLRLDHGALAALLTPKPTMTIVRAIRTILSAHNPLEEGSDGVYEKIAQHAGSDAAEMLEKIKAFPDVPVAARIDSPQLITAAKRALERAGYSASLLDDDSGPVSYI